ncbi:hypothetical protein BC940DRAFT_299812 [Gongronella butleri]|nr:hypothetical protein BC940DRAFT_299812 [Gongronella butleri]
MSDHDATPRDMPMASSTNASALPLMQSSITQSSSSPTTPPPVPPAHDYHPPPQPDRYLFPESPDIRHQPSPVLPTYEETIQPYRPFRTRPSHIIDNHNDIERPVSLLEQSIDEKSQRPRRKKVLHYLCCICCPCLPMWMRSICCLLLFSLVIFAVAAGILAALFQMPTVTYNGTTNDPNGLPYFVNTSTSSFQINLGLNFTITNPNVESIHFEKIRAIAFYPGVDSVSIGGGNISNVDVGQATATQLILPLELHYDTSMDPGHTMLYDIMTRCGLIGTSKQNLAVTFLLKPSLRVIGVPLSPTIREATSFPCPIQPGQLVIPNDAHFAN